MISEQQIKNVSNRSSTDFTNLFSDPQEISSAIEDAKQVIEKKEDKPSNKKDLEEISLEKTNTEKNSENEIDSLREQYGLMEDQNLTGVDYDSLFSYLEHHLNPEEIYGGQEESEEGHKRFWVMSDEEAKETIEQIQLSYSAGNKDEVSYEKREAFHNWQEFNKSLLMLYHSLSSIKSDNIDYGNRN